MIRRVRGAPFLLTAQLWMLTDTVSVCEEDKQSKVRNNIDTIVMLNHYLLRALPKIASDHRRNYVQLTHKLITIIVYTLWGNLSKYALNGEPLL